MIGEENTEFGHKLPFKAQKVIYNKLMFITRRNFLTSLFVNVSAVPFTVGQLIPTRS